MANHASPSNEFYAVKLKMEKILQKPGSVTEASKKSRTSLQIYHAIQK